MNARFPCSGRKARGHRRPVVFLSIQPFSDLSRNTTECCRGRRTRPRYAQTYGASVPNHITANYPTTCATCHTPWVTQAWLGAVFNHTWFKLPHGKVSSNQCVDCHINANNYTKFSCENCHTVPTAHQPGMSHPSVCSPSPACWYNPPTRCYDCHKG